MHSIMYSKIIHFNARSLSQTWGGVAVRATVYVTSIPLIVWLHLESLLSDWQNSDFLFFLRNATFKCHASSFLVHRITEGIQFKKVSPCRPCFSFDGKRTPVCVEHRGVECCLLTLYREKKSQLKDKKYSNEIDHSTFTFIICLLCPLLLGGASPNITLVSLLIQRFSHQNSLIKTTQDLVWGLL